MWETMYAAKGVGLAAPQIGVSKRISVIDISVGEDRKQEDCALSIPEIISRRKAADGRRRMFEHSRLSRACDAREQSDGAGAEMKKAKPLELTGEELLARAFQHEIDHLNGILFIGHLSALKRDIIRRKIKKLQKAGEWD